MRQETHPVEFVNQARNNMKKLTTMIAAFSLFLGLMLMAAPTYAQSEAAAPSKNTESVAKPVMGVSQAPAKKACTKTKASCTGAKAMGGSSATTVANPGMKKKCSKAAKTSCTGAKAMGGGSATTVANPGMNKSSKASCAGAAAKKCNKASASKKACTGSKAATMKAESTAPVGGGSAMK
ncbi:MAG: hypothetical protein AAF570_26860 [Bacteroidota bacterium]